jgi:signal transduction histidine kinase
VDLNRSVGYTTTVARNEWKYVAELEIIADDALPPVPVEAGPFNQVILNLIINAVHAIAARLGPESTEKGRITISTATRDEWVEIRIKDDGCGMPESVSQRAFDPLFTTKEVRGGTGRGLPIAHSVIVDKHKGTIQIESEEGVGTEFIIGYR